VASHEQEKKRKEKKNSIYIYVIYADKPKIHDHTSKEN
jgi:hypothetical protein